MTSFSHSSRALQVVCVLIVLAFSLPASAQDPNYALSLTGGTGLPGQQIVSLGTLDNTGGDLKAWSYGVCHDPAVISVSGAVSGSTTLTVNNGSPPEFESLDLFAGAGVTHAVVICFTACAVLPIGNGYELVDITYDLDSALPQTTTVCFCGTLGTPNVQVIVTGPVGNDIVPVTSCGTLEIQNPPFRRTDCNNNGVITVSDPVFHLEVLFGGIGLTPDCVDACDSNDDGSMDIADASYTLNYLFDMGPPPPDPFVTCGGDAIVDTLDCESFAGCP